jgi:hypothetical protein
MRFTIWCVLGVLNAVYTVWWLFQPDAAHAAEAVPMALGSEVVWAAVLASALGVAGLAGYWLMRRWGVYVYSAATMLMVVGVVIGITPVVVAIRMAVIAGFGWFFIRNMA